MEETKKEKISNELKCTSCAAILEFKPGTTNLTCTYCGAENVIEQKAEKIEELDYVQFINEKLDKEETVDVVAVKCDSCGASITLDPNITSDECPYCDQNIVVEGGSTSKLLKPKSVLPFKIPQKKAAESFKTWISKLWFAPSDLKQNTRNEKIDGIYLPYWTYDTDTNSHYTGQRGDYYYETENYTTTNDQGETVTKQRQVRHTRWTPVSGSVAISFDDVLVIASNSLPAKYTERLDPWYLKDLLPYDNKYLSGFRSETYQVQVTTGMEVAKSKMDPTIRTAIRRNISGDEQRITSVDTSYQNITFKHILLPIWISSYRYRDKVYRFLINGQTGEVQGERPYSALKIALTVLAAIAIIVIAIIIFKK
jgi:LSD1 subclass zinc finger protein